MCSGQSSDSPTAAEKFAQLDERDQQKILDKHRDWNTSFDWWDSTYEDFIADMKDVGVDVDRRHERTPSGKDYTRPSIQFSGFWSQGDGASFDGDIGDWAVVFKDYPLLLQHHKTADTRYFKWNSHGHYSHSGTLSFDSDFCMPPVYVESDGLRYHAYDQLCTDLDTEWEKFCDDMEAKVRGYCDKLYNDLEEEHGYLTSDEAVLDSLIANDVLEDELKEFENVECD